MKKILIVLFLTFSATVGALIAPSGRSTGLDYAGAVIDSSVERHFINVKAGAAYAIGTAVILDLSADDGATVTTSTAASAVPLCIISPVACVSGKICKCQKFGEVAVALFDSTSANAVAGQRWYMSTNNAGYLSARAIGATAAAEEPGGIFYDAASASGSIQVFVNL